MEYSKDLKNNDLVLVFQKVFRTFISNNLSMKYKLR